jgi:hypothetical protein
MIKYLSKMTYVLCDLITMHKCYVFLTVVEKNNLLLMTVSVQIYEIVKE